MNLNGNIRLLIRIMIYSLMMLISVNAFSLNSSLQNQINRIMLSNDSNTNVSMNENESTNENRFAFVLFYMSTCPHCQRFDPILKVFSTSNHIPVLAYTLDGNALPSFPNSFTPTKNEVSKFFSNEAPVVPTLFLMDQKTHRIYPMMRGEAAQYQLSERYVQLRDSILNGNVGKNNKRDFN